MGIGIASVASGISKGSILPALKGLNVNVVAGSSRSSEAAKSALADFGYSGATAHTSLESLLSNPSVGTVVICGANGTHAEQAIAALEAGKDVLVEKPPAVDLKQLKRLLVAAAAAEGRLGGIVQKVTAPAFDLLHRAAEDGRFGAQASLSAELCWFRKKEYYGIVDGKLGGWKGTLQGDGSVLHNQGYHHLDMLVRLAAAVQNCSPGDNPFKWVSAHGCTQFHPELEFPDTVTVTAMCHDGGMVQLFVTTAAREEKKDWLEIRGNANRALLVSDALDEWEFAVPTSFDEEAQTLLQQDSTVDTSGEPLAGLGKDAHARVIDSFVDGRDRHLWDPVGHGMGLTIIDAAIRSMKGGGKRVRPADLMEYVAD